MDLSQMSADLCPKEYPNSNSALRASSFNCTTPSSTTSTSLLTPQPPAGFLEQFSSPKEVSSSKVPQSPNKPRYSDRYIPARVGNAWSTTYLDNVEVSPAKRVRTVPPIRPVRKLFFENNENQPSLYSSLLRNEVIGYNQNENLRDAQLGNNSSPFQKPPVKRKLFHYDSSDRSSNTVLGPMSSYVTCPISPKSEEMLRTAKHYFRYFPTSPYKILDAPGLSDDYYKNTLDWSSENVLCIALGSDVYLKNLGVPKQSEHVQLLHSYEERYQYVTSLSWHEKGNMLAVGTGAGQVQIWDVATSRVITSFDGHTARVGVLAWNGDILATGSNDNMIYLKDIREPPRFSVSELHAHSGEVCGLKWSLDGARLASGGNDNMLHLWKLQSCVFPYESFEQHEAAVKAISWSPHQHGLLATGSGSAERRIRFFDTISGSELKSINAGSQVCNLAWSKHAPEIISTHGYPKNNICIWQYPTLDQIGKLTGHLERVIYLAMSPDGEDIATAAGGDNDGTIRLWKVYHKTKLRNKGKSLLNLFENAIR